MKSLPLITCCLVLADLVVAAAVSHKKHKGNKNSVKFGTKHKQRKPKPRPTAPAVANVAASPGAGPAVVNAATGAPKDIHLADMEDLIYFSNVTIGGNPYVVQLDTGSSDLWVRPSGAGLLPNTLRSDLSYSLTYGIGHARGPIVTAEVEFAGFHIQRQALISANDAVNPVLDLGAVGVLGLGFTSLSAIDSTVNDTNEQWGRSLLYNIFAEDPALPNVITFLYNRDDDPQSPAEGSFTISEIDEDYTAISKQPQIPTFPVDDPTRWTVLLDSFTANGKPYTVKSNVPGVPQGKVSMLLDSGTSFSYAPESVVRALYSNVTGAKWNDLDNRFNVPCDSEANISFLIGGTQYDLHPLDMVTPDPLDPTICVGAWIAQSFSDEFDFLIGANVLRAFYSLYDFSAVTSPGAPIQPFVQLLQLRSRSDMVLDFHAVRGGQPAGIVVINPADPGGSTGTDPGVTPGAPGGGTTSAQGVDQSISDGINKVLGYLPILLGVLGLNAVLLIVIVLAGLVLFCRRKKGRSGRKSPTSPAAAGGFGLSPIGGQQNGGDYRPVSTVSDIERDRRDSHSTTAKSILVPGSPTEPNITLTGVPELHSDAPSPVPSPISVTAPPPPAIAASRLSVATPPPGMAPPIPGQRISVSTPPPGSARHSMIHVPPPGIRGSMLGTPPPNARHSMAGTPPPGARHSMINTWAHAPDSPNGYSPTNPVGPPPTVPPRRAPPPAPLQRPHSVAVSVAAGVPVPASPVGSFSSGLDTMEPAMLAPPQAPFAQGVPQQHRQSVASLRGVPGAEQHFDAQRS